MPDRISKRDFLKLGVAGVAGAALAAVPRGQPQEKPRVQLVEWYDKLHPIEVQGIVEATSRIFLERSDPFYNIRATYSALERTSPNLFTFVLNDRDPIGQRLTNPNVPQQLASRVEFTFYKYGFTPPESISSFGREFEPKDFFSRPSSLNVLVDPVAKEVTYEVYEVVPPGKIKVLDVQTYGHTSITEQWLPFGLSVRPQISSLLLDRIEFSAGKGAFLYSDSKGGEGVINVVSAEERVILKENPEDFNDMIQSVAFCLNSKGQPFLKVGMRTNFGGTYTATNYSPARSRNIPLFSDLVAEMPGGTNIKVSTKLESLSDLKLNPNVSYEVELDINEQKRTIKLNNSYAYREGLNPLDPSEAARSLMASLCYLLYTNQGTRLSADEVFNYLESIILENDQAGSQT